MTTVKEAEKIYGEELLKKMLKSKCLVGITMTMTDSGEPDIPDSDWENAKNDVLRKKYIMWD